MMQSGLCTAQVRCDIISFSTISVRYVQLVKQKLVYACMHASHECCPVCAYIPELLILSEFLRQFGTPPSAA